VTILFTYWLCYDISPKQRTWRKGFTVLGPTGSSICKDEGLCRPRIRRTNVPCVASVGAQLPWGVNRVKVSALVDFFLRVRNVTSKTPVGVAVVHDGLEGREGEGGGGGGGRVKQRRAVHCRVLGHGCEMVRLCGTLQHTSFTPPSVSCTARYT
jgi:hypothetical protein